MQLHNHVLTEHQMTLLARAKAVTTAQFDIAREFLHVELQKNPAGSADAELLAMVQILATNYQASVIKAVG